MDTALPYVRERSQFGKPIGSFQLIQAKLADIYVALEASRALSYRTAQDLDRGKLVPKDCAAAILHAAEHATQCTLQAIQVWAPLIVFAHHRTRLNSVACARALYMVTGAWNPHACHMSVFMVLLW